MEEELELLEDEALNHLDIENMDKLNQSLEYYISDPGKREYNYLIRDNLVEFLDYGRHIKYGYYPEYPSKLDKTLDLLIKAHNITSDSNVKNLIEDAIDNIKDYFKRISYHYEAGDKYQKYSKEDYKFPEYHYRKNPYQPSKAPKELVKSMAKELTEYNPKVPTSENWSNLANEIALVHDNKIPQPIEETEDLHATKVLNDALELLKNRRTEYKKKLEEVKELNSRKLELSSKTEELKQFREKMLKKAIDQLIVDYNKE